MRLHLSPNPVLIKELRGRMRGPRAYLFLSATLALFGLVSYGLYRIARAATQSFGLGFGSTPGALIGQLVFTGLAFLALLAICAIAPALTAGAISSEHERKSFDMLMATPLRPASVLFGKLAASMGYVVLLLAAAVPLVSLSYLFGGVATADMIQTLLLLLGYALTFSVIGLFFSTLFRRTGRASVASYVVLALFVFGSTFAYVVAAVVGQQPPPSWLLALNPFSALASALVNVSTPDVFSVGGPITSLLWFVGGGGGFDPRMPAPFPLWRYTVGIYAGLTVALYFASTQLVKPVRRFRLGKRGWAGVAAFVGLSILAALVFYGPLTPERLLAWLRWSTSSPRDLIANGRFDAPLEQVWQVSTESEHANQSGGEVVPFTEDGRTAVRLSRTGEGHAETRITQAIDQAVPSDGWLQVRVTLRVQSDNLYLCGILGSECPLMIKLSYEDAAGRPHEWTQGLNAETVPLDFVAFPETCTTCETPRPFVSVPPKEWYTYESPNILDSLTPAALPRRIVSITLAAGGHTYETEVAEVALLVREGHPPDEQGPMPWATPTPAFFPPGVIIRELPVVVPPVPLPPPLPTEAPVIP